MQVNALFKKAAPAPAKTAKAPAKTQIKKAPRVAVAVAAVAAESVRRRRAQGEREDGQEGRAEAAAKKAVAKKAPVKKAPVKKAPVAKKAAKSPTAAKEALAKWYGAYLLKSDRIGSFDARDDARTRGDARARWESIVKCAFARTGRRGTRAREDRAEIGRYG